MTAMISRSDGGDVVAEFRASAEDFLASWDIDMALWHARRVVGRWHPTGFMVFRTKRKFGGRPVRVHCWPPNLRVVAAGTPPLHTHVWPLAARVLHGTYVERVYDLVTSDEDGLIGYEVRYRSRIDSTIVPDGSHFAVRAGFRRTFRPGETHHLDAGEWHETTIPMEACVVTAMVTGAPEYNTPLLAGRVEYPVSRHVRRPVTPNQFKKLRNALR